MDQEDGCVIPIFRSFRSTRTPEAPQRDQHRGKGLCSMAAGPVPVLLLLGLLLPTELATGQPLRAATLWVVARWIVAQPTKLLMKL